MPINSLEESNDDIMRRLKESSCNRSKKILGDPKMRSSFQELSDNFKVENLPLQFLEEEVIKKMIGYFENLAGTLKDFEDGKLPDFSMSTISTIAKNIEISLDDIASKIRKSGGYSSSKKSTDFVRQLDLLKVFMKFVEGNVKVLEHKFSEAYDIFNYVNVVMNKPKIKKIWESESSNSLNSMGLNGVAEIFKESFEDLQSSRLYLCAQNWLGGNLSVSKMAKIISEFLEGDLEMVRDASNIANLSEVYERLLGELVAVGNSSYALDMFDSIMSKLGSNLEENLPLKFKLIHQACIACIKERKYTEVEKLVQEHVGKAKPEDIKAISDIYSDILYQQGLAYKELKEPQKAFQHFCKAIEFAGPQNNFKPGSTEFKSLLETLPKLSKFKLIYHACLSYIKQDQYVEVEKLVQEHVDKDKPKMFGDIGDVYSDILYQQGLALQQLGVLDKAFKYFGIAIEFAGVQSQNLYADFDKISEIKAASEKSEVSQEMRNFIKFSLNHALIRTIGCYQSNEKMISKIEQLLKLGADPFEVDKYGDSGFAVALRQSKINVAKIFIKSIRDKDNASDKKVLDKLLEDDEINFCTDIALHICKKDEEGDVLRKAFNFTGDNVEGAKTCFTEAQELYEMLSCGSDSSFLLDANDYI